LGIPLFQEQILRLAMVAAGFSAGEAEQLRRAIGAWRRPGLLEGFRAGLRERILARGFPVSFADQLYEQIKGFGEYGFPESHAASFAILAYVSAWLKRHYPAPFAAALLNSQPMGFYAPAQIVQDAQKHGVAVYPMDVAHSDWDCTLEAEGSALRLGFCLVKGLRQALARVIVEAREQGPFRSVQDFVRRTRLNRPVMARLAAADAFGSLGLNRRAALWQALDAGDELSLFSAIEAADVPLPYLPEMPLDREIGADYNSTGLSLKAHPIGLIRSELNLLQALSAEELEKKSATAHVRVAGLILVRQRPATAKGTLFMTLEDETGTVNLVVWPRVWQRYRRVVHEAVALIAEGKVERAGKVIHVVASKLEDLSESLREINLRSRDFC
jgi:error-prone DNA polymerase